MPGGADSSATAAIIGAMCDMVTIYAQKHPQSPVADELRRLCHKSNTSDPNHDKLWVPPSPNYLANQIFYTAFLGTVNSSYETKDRAQRLANQIGSYHFSIPIDLAITAILTVFTKTTGKEPQFQSRGGTPVEDLALQNIQARLRMVFSYLFAQLLPWVRGNPGFLLVLGSANVDEGLRGYMTKYDCSSADVNPIGGISKTDLKKMLLWGSERYGWRVLKDVALANPTAELRPIEVDDKDNEKQNDHSQSDEEDMGMTYAELGMFGRLRKIGRCGPVSM